MGPLEKFKNLKQKKPKNGESLKRKKNPGKVISAAKVFSKLAILTNT
jgi:hypothetical protein